MGDMAVSNSIGSNVFDILIGLGLPWALQTLAVDYGSYVSAFSASHGLGQHDFVSKKCSQTMSLKIGSMGTVRTQKQSQ